MAGILDLGLGAAQALSELQAMQARSQPSPSQRQGMGILSTPTDAQGELTEAQRDLMVEPSGFKRFLFGGMSPEQFEKELRVSEATRSAEGEQQAQALSQQLSLYGDPRSIPGIGQALAGPGGADLANQLAQDPRFNPAVAREQQQAQAEAASMAQLQEIEKRQKIALNNQKLRNNGFTSEQIAQSNMQVAGFGRAVGALNELDRLSNMDINTFKGGPAAMTRYITDSLMPTVMELINTGVINSPAEMERVMSFLPSLTGAGGQVTFDATNKAKINEFRRWVSGKATDMADAYGLDLTAYQDRAMGRNVDELEAGINALYPSEPTPPEGFSPVGPNLPDPSYGNPLQIPRALERDRPEGGWMEVIGEGLGQAYGPRGAGQ